MSGFQKLNAIPEDMARELQKMLREYRVTNGFRRSAAAAKPDKPLGFEQKVSFTVMLLEDLAGDRTAVAEELEIDTKGYTLDVVLLGYPGLIETFPLRVKRLKGRGDTLEEVFVDVPLNATAEEFRKITGLNGTVTLGARQIKKADGTETLATPVRWRVTWPDQSSGELVAAGTGGNRWFSRVEPCLVVGTGRTKTVIQTIPTGWDTPLKAGAICEVIRGRNGIFKVIGAEARLWNTNALG